MAELSEEIEEFAKANINYLGLRYVSFHQAAEDFKDYASINLTGVYAIERTMDRLNLGKRVSRFTKMLVGEHSPRVDIPGLYPPQAALAFAMLRAEQDNFVLTPGLRDLSDDPAVRATKPDGIEINMGRVVERLSFGKTYLIPKLVAYRPIPRLQNGALSRENVFYLGSPPASDPLVPSNLVVIGNSCTKEWKRHAFVVSTAKSLEKLVLKRDQLPPLIAIRSGSFTYAGAKRPALTHFVREFGDVTFARVFYDDFDCLNLADDQPIPKALFSWLLSSTDSWELHEDNDPSCFVSFSWGTFKLGGCIGWPLTAIRCNRNFSSLEFELPKIKWFRFSQRDDYEGLIDCVAGILHGQEFERLNFESDVFLEGIGEVDGSSQPKKILVSVELKEAQQLVVQTLRARLGDSAVVLLDKRNAHTFGEKPEPVGVCRMIHGLNMGYLTDVVVEADYERLAVEQVVGRGQRIGRTASLRAYLSVD